jgi:hypothetical protein
MIWAVENTRMLDRAVSHASRDWRGLISFNTYSSVVFLNNADSLYDERIDFWR